MRGLAGFAGIWRELAEDCDLRRAIGVLDMATRTAVAMAPGHGTRHPAPGDANSHPHGSRRTGGQSDLREHDGGSLVRKTAVEAGRRLATIRLLFARKHPRILVMHFRRKLDPAPSEG